MRIFQKMAVGVLVLFFGILALAVVIAYSRVSGSTGLDMSKVQKMRLEAKRNAVAEQ